MNKIDLQASHGVCCEVQPYLFDSAEMASAIREMVKRHLATCDDCSALLHEELALTQFLGEPASVASADMPSGNSSNRMPVPIVLAATLMIMTGLVLWASVAKHNQELAWQASTEHESNQVPQSNDGSSETKVFGSIVSRPVFKNAVHFAKSEEWNSRELEPSNHVQLPAGSAATIELADHGSVHALGPATFEIDHVDESWKLTLLSGQLRVSLDGDARICVASQHGTSWLGKGSWVVDEDSAIVAQQEEKKGSSDDSNDETDVDELYKQAVGIFSGNAAGTKEEMQDSADLLQQVIEHPDVNPTLKQSARFYRAAALSNLGQHAAVLEIVAQIEESTDDGFSQVLQVMAAEAHHVLGHTEEAKILFETILEKWPETPYRPMIESWMGVSPSGGSKRITIAPKQKLPFTSEAKSLAFQNGQRPENYLVVSVGLENQNPELKGFRDAAEKAKQFHNATHFSFDGTNFDSLRETIEQTKPANVLFVMPPDLLDINFHRTIFQMAPTFDNDLFADFAWGYLIARDGETVLKFWDRIEALHKNGMASRRWVGTGVIEGVSHIPASGLSEFSRAAGFESEQIYFGVQEKDPNIHDFVATNLKRLESASVITMTGNGDPQGIWLFEGNRNMDSSKHWEFDPKKVGQDPNDEMLRIKADQFRQLNLQSPIIWSGTCHSGACNRVFVEGDIVSTFGTSDSVQQYEMTPDESLCMAFIDAGCGALLVPIAANHGMSVSMESKFAVKYGATLGDAVKSTYNDILMQADGVPALVFAKQGDAKTFFNEPVMQSGGANRILIGDPALKLFEATELPDESVVVTHNSEKKQLQVELTWKEGFQAHGWNMYADGRGGNRRMTTRISCNDYPEIVAAGLAGKLTGATEMVDEEGAKVECETIIAFEKLGDQSWLHLQASANSDDVAYKQHTATFVVEWK